MRHAACLILAYAALVLATTFARAEPLAVHGPVAAGGLFTGHVAFLLDPEHRFSAAEAAGPHAGEFTSVTGASADFGYTRDAIWLRLALHNDSTDTTAWRLHLRENFLPEFEVWLIRATGPPVLLERHDPHTPFHARQIAWPELVVPFTLAPGHAGTILMRYTSGGSSELSFALHTAESFERFAARKTAKNFVYYGMMLFLILAALVAWAITRNVALAAYGAYAASGLMFLMHADGNTFQYLWPGWPLFNAYASVLVGASLVVTGSSFARIFLQTARYHPVMDRLLLGAILLALGMVAATAVMDAQPIKKALILVATGSTLLFTIAGLVAARRRFREVRFYVIAWTGAVASSGIMTARHWLGIEISEEFQFDSMRIVLMADAALMGLAILDRINQLKQARQSELEQRLAVTRRNLDLSRRLADLDARYGLALSLAQSSQRRLADTVHDLREPLMALRLNVQRLVSERPESAAAAPRAEDFDGAFDYVEQLVSRELARHIAGNAADRLTVAPPPPDPADDCSLPESYAVDDVLSAVRDMFAPAAVAKGVEFHHVPCSAQVDLPPLALMRIASNLVSNAVKYTDTGKVLLGCRRRAGQLWLEVHDTGPGLTAEEFSRMQTRSVRSEATRDKVAGTGLGLAIVGDLLEEHGLELRLLPGRNGGTSLGLALSPAPQNPKWGDHPIGPDPLSGYS